MQIEITQADFDGLECFQLDERGYEVQTVTYSTHKTEEGTLKQITIYLVQPLEGEEPLGDEGSGADYSCEFESYQEGYSDGLSVGIALGKQRAQDEQNKQTANHRSASELDRM